MSLEQVRRALESVVAITVTPFDSAGGVDVDGYVKVLARYVDAGIGTVTPNGNTSEFYSLDPDELALGLRTTTDAVADRVTVIAGVGHDVARAVAMARDAADAGAHGVMVHQPVHPYQSLDGWVDYHRAIAEAVPELGVVPYVRSPLITADAFVALADTCPNVVGVKYAVPDPLSLPGLIEAVGAERLAWVCGLAETWAPYFWLGGARGFTSGLVNVAPHQSLQLLGLLQAGEHEAAMAVWRRIKPFEDMRARAGNAANVSVVKEALAQLGLCRRSVRPPISEVSPAERDEVAAFLASL
ncbi:dihydrodipicolinate synthase family protein [Planosporangium mesophilum]|uniref:Dihydrodipicolinate synthase family protein n=1 Tax=Planosporangium mesophilum TaxID=689768 RepID=A0A8J3T980_9ACTN|nr:dihydrodipicolinate synthase family protein [Planosporangium mesophilum]NJC81394.1 dihydrodipicolinate synthase family protein [Planosporangium mesophilum]GII20952.1 dihydrodipicolinate synthase family protein [Planosporangium mesophilum]